MVDIPNFLPIPISRPTDTQQQRPDNRQQQERLNQSQNTNSNAQRVNNAKAPLNIVPTDDALDRLISRAQDAQTAGRILDRGSILNLIV